MTLISLTLHLYLRGKAIKNTGNKQTLIIIKKIRIQVYFVLHPFPVLPLMIRLSCPIVEPGDVLSFLDEVLWAKKCQGELSRISAYPEQHAFFFMFNDKN